VLLMPMIGWTHFALTHGFGYLILPAITPTLIWAAFLRDFLGAVSQKTRQPDAAPSL
jgi:hypothetical protein